MRSLHRIAIPLAHLVLGSRHASHCLGSRVQRKMVCHLKNLFKTVQQKHHRSNVFSLPIHDHVISYMYIIYYVVMFMELQLSLVSRCVDSFLLTLDTLHLALNLPRTFDRLTSNCISAYSSMLARSRKHKLLPQSVVCNKNAAVEGVQTMFDTCFEAQGSWGSKAVLTCFNVCSF